MSVKEICIKCGGKCCFGATGEEIIPLSKFEFEKLSKLRSDVQFLEVDSSNGGVMYAFFVPQGGCPFLKGGRCELNSEDKPLNCDIFPLIFRLECNIVKFYFDISGSCKFVNEIMLDNVWFARVIDRCLLELPKWSKKELLYFSSLSDNIVLKDTGKIYKVGD